MSLPIELILARHLATHLAVPAFLVEPDGTMVFFNEAAEKVLGRRFDDAGKMPFEEWTSIFAVRDSEGEPLDIDELPLVKVLRNNRPWHAKFEITGLDGAKRSLEVSAFPLEAQGQRHLGAVALFWETPSEDG
jgi:PAS domain-containing protein